MRQKLMGSIPETFVLLFHEQYMFFRCAKRENVKSQGKNRRSRRSVAVVMIQSSRAEGQARTGPEGRWVDLFRLWTRPTKETGGDNQSIMST